MRNVLLVLTFGFLLFAAGCDRTAGQVLDAYEERINQVKAQVEGFDADLEAVNSEIDLWQEQLAEATDSETIDEISQKIDAGQEKILRIAAEKDTAEAALENLREDVASLSREGDGISAGLDAASVTVNRARETGWIPAPIDGGLGILGLALAGLADWRRRSLRNRTGEIVNSIDKLRKEDDEFGRVFNEKKKDLRTIMPSSAAKLVEDLTK